jgi:nucleoside-diphosphate-sugar epimerase
MIYIVGANGYIGSNLLIYLEDHGYTVIGIGRGELFKLDKIKQTDIIICAAGYGIKPNEKDTSYFLYDNAVLPYLLSQYGVKVLHLSSYFEFFKTDIYATSKALASEVIGGYNNVSIIYLYNIFGDGPVTEEYSHRFIKHIKNCIKNKELFTLTTPGACRDFIHIRHILKGIRELISAPIGVYHFSSGKYITLIAVHQAIKNKCGDNFISVIKDIGPNNYTTDCYTPSNSYFKNINSIDDILSEVC